ncbi:MAG: hypothetical protein KDE19_03890 [Caldilineaceae bacterium]|nr:hypothetical protein [Caldilineaceae bacterium]
MGNKTLSQEELSRLLAENNVSGRNGYHSQAFKNALADNGSWITSQEQFDDLYKSVDDFEKFLRS